MNESLKKIKEGFDKKVEQRRQEESARQQIGLLSSLLDNAVSRFGQIISGLKVEAPTVNVSPPIIPEIKIPEIKIPEIVVPEIKLPPINIPN